MENITQPIELLGMLMFIGAAIVALIYITDYELCHFSLIFGIVVLIILVLIGEYAFNCNATNTIKLNILFSKLRGCLPTKLIWLQYISVALIVMGLVGYLRVSFTRMIDKIKST